MSNTAPHNSKRMPNQCIQRQNYVRVNYLVMIFTQQKRFTDLLLHILSTAGSVFLVTRRLRPMSGLDKMRYRLRFVHSQLAQTSRFCLHFLLKSTISFQAFFHFFLFFLLLPFVPICPLGGAPFSAQLEANVT
jgi:hypothetical protein